MDLSLLVESSPPPEVVHRAMALERARGVSAELLAQRFGMSAPAVRSLCAQTWFIELTLKVQVDECMTFDERLEGLAEIALQKQAEILHHSRDPKLLEKLSNSIIDRAKGKATQRIDMRSMNINVNQELGELEKELELTERRIHEITKYAKAETNSD